MTAERPCPCSRIAVIVMTIALAAAVTFADELSSLERLGQQIYTRGEGAAPIQAVLGYGQTTIDASVVPCASCHGADGRGRPEGGVVPADITAAALRAASYTDHSIKRAITMGVRASGSPLAVAMPRYQMSSGDMDALLAYLRRVGELRDPGLTSDSIRIGVLLPPGEHLAGVRDAVRNALQTFFDARNRSGTLFGRRIEVVFTECDGLPPARAAAAAKFIAAEKPFALVGSFTDGADDELAAVAQAQGIPLLATISSHARSDPSNRYVRNLVAGLHDQVRALADFAGRKFPKARVTVVHDADERSQGIAAAAVDELRTMGISATLTESSVTPQTLKGEGIEVIVYTGAPAGLAKLAMATRELAWSPVILVPGTLIHPAALNRSQTSAHVYIALPMGPNDQTAEAITAWRKLVGEREAYQASQFAALASAQLLIAALERAGRDLTRERFLAAIDGINALETGLVPPLTFSPSRHIGSTGAYVVAVTDDVPDDQRTVWIDPG